MSQPFPKAPDAPLDKIEWRVDGQPYERNGKYIARFVPYLSRAIVADLMDQWVGPLNWRERYQPGELAGKPVVWATVEVYNPETGEWIARHDVGKPSNFEGEKGSVSDAFKRAASLGFGAGRNVYDLPVLWAPCDKNKKGQAVPNNETLPAIKRQLKSAGYNDAGGRVGVSVADGGEDVGEEVEAPAPKKGTATPIRKNDPEDPFALDGTPISKRTLKNLAIAWSRVVERGIFTEEELRSNLQKKYGVESRKDLTEDAGMKITKALNAKLAEFSGAAEEVSE